jgi:hypothetical protein
MAKPVPGFPIIDEVDFVSIDLSGAQTVFPFRVR